MPPLRIRRARDINGKPPRQYQEGRICQRCGIELSRYNSSKFCFPHQPVKYPMLRRPTY